MQIRVCGHYMCVQGWIHKMIKVDIVEDCDIEKTDEVS